MLRPGADHAAPVPRRASARRCPKPEDIQPPGDAERGRPVLHELREAAADRQVRHVDGLRRRAAACTTTIDLNLQKVARQAIDEVADRPEGPGRGARRDRPAHRRRARDGRRQELPPEPVQPGGAGRAPAGLVVQAVRARRRARPGDRAARRPSRRSRSTIPFDDKIWHVTNYEGDYLGSADLRTATTYSDNSVYAQLTATVGPASVARMAHRLGIRSPLNSLPLDRAGRGGGQPAGDGAGLRDLRARRPAHRRLAFGNEPRAIRWVDQQTKTNGKIALLDLNKPVAPAGARPGQERAADEHPPDASSSPAPARPPSSAAAGARPARPGRPRTTATPGSSATRRSSSPPSGSAIRTRSARC